MAPTDMPRVGIAIWLTVQKLLRKGKTDTEIIAELRDLGASYEDLVLCIIQSKEN